MSGAMRRPLRVVACLSMLLVACSSPPPLVEAPMAPAPMAEAAAPAVAAAGRAFASTELLRHAWRTPSGRTMQVVLRLSWSASADDAAAAHEQVRHHWPAASQRARQLLESADLCSEAGTLQCEEQLRVEMTRELFPRRPGSPGAEVERVVWRRLLWS